MKELIGKRCSIEFNLPDDEWPLSGFPAWATVEKVDMPMIKLGGWGMSIWVNVSIIKEIRSYEI
jgi:hypothetical protein